MKKNSSALEMPINGQSIFSGKGSNSVVNSKKIEGYDRTAPSTGFTTKIEKIKNRPKQQTLEG